jgi:glyoxylase-like metal-dependent hydrolase (beta-lactamase superfamily II)
MLNFAKQTNYKATQNTLRMIHTIDLNFLNCQQSIAAFLLETTDAPVLIETGPHSTIAHLTEGLKKYGYTLDDIKHVFITHIHLDHAGAAWDFAQRGATIYLHPAGQAHLANPEKLMSSARRIYQDQMDALWGQMNAIAPERLRPVEHGETLFIGDTSIVAWHTPGHAIHHIAWQVGNNMFTGDVAGVRINQKMPVPPCPPPDIDLAAWQQSIQLLQNLDLQALYLTHFGKINDVAKHLSQLEQNLTDWVNWMLPYYKEQYSPETITPLFAEFVKQKLLANGASNGDLDSYEAANPSWMSVAGLLRYWNKQSAKTQ